MVCFAGNTNKFLNPPTQNQEFLSYLIGKRSLSWISIVKKQQLHHSIITLLIHAGEKAYIVKTCSCEIQITTQKGSAGAKSGAKSTSIMSFS
jgi:hypothetical protein